MLPLSQVQSFNVIQTYSLQMEPLVIGLQHTIGLRKIYSVDEEDTELGTEWVAFAAFLFHCRSLLLPSPVSSSPSATCRLFPLLLQCLKR